MSTDTRKWFNAMANSKPAADGFIQEMLLHDNQHYTS